MGKLKCLCLDQVRDVCHQNVTFQLILRQYSCLSEKYLVRIQATKLEALYCSRELLLHTRIAIYRVVCFKLFTAGSLESLGEETIGS